MALSINARSSFGIELLIKGLFAIHIFVNNKLTDTIVATDKEMERFIGKA